MELDEFIKMAAEDRRQYEAYKKVPNGAARHPFAKKTEDFRVRYAVAQRALMACARSGEPENIFRTFFFSLGFSYDRLFQVRSEADKVLGQNRAKFLPIEEMVGQLETFHDRMIFTLDCRMLWGKSLTAYTLDLWESLCYGVCRFKKEEMEFVKEVWQTMTTGKDFPTTDSYNIPQESGDYLKSFFVAEGTMSAPFLCIDLATWKYREVSDAPDIRDSACRTNQLWMRRIPAGTFTMGSPNNELGIFDDELQHVVTLTQNFYIGIFPVTQRQWELVMGNNPSYFSSNRKGESYPVEGVSYDDICGKNRPWPNWSNQSVAPDSFLGRIRERTGLQELDLPTEAQWEYACRSGTKTALNNGKNLTVESGVCNNLGEVAWYSENSVSGTHPVGKKKPNAWGLYDMHGNVDEWCKDWDGGYPKVHVTDPVGPASGSRRVGRGGSWFTDARFCRAANRNCFDPSFRFNDLGFRLALVPVQ